MHNYIAGIDLGSQSINVALASHNDDNISYKYLGRVNSGGIEKGQVTDLNLLSNSIKTCINSINETYDVNNIDWSVGINNQNVKWSLVSGTSYIKNGYGLITESDINDTLLTCQENAARDNEKIIYMCPVKYYVDGICQLKQPIGKTAEELKIDAICFSIKSDEFFNIKNALMLSGIKKFKLSISSFELNNLVLNDSTLSKNVLMIDVGAELTNVFQFDNNNLIYMDTIPIGGQSITSDLSICGKIDLNTADEIKMLYSSRYRTLYKQKLIGEKLKEAITYDIDLYHDVVEARLEQLLEIIKNNLIKNGTYTDIKCVYVLGAGIVNFERINSFIEDKLLKKTKLISNNDLNLINYSDINTICLVKNAIDRLKLNEDDFIGLDSSKDKLNESNTENDDNEKDNDVTIVSKIKKVLEYIF